MLAEGILLGTALILIFIGPFSSAAFTGYALVVLLAYFVVLYFARGDVDPKPFRDLAIPIIFIMLGRIYPFTEAFHRLMKFLTTLILAMGLFEYFFPSTFTGYFDILKYYIAKGATEASVADFITDGLNINGQRPENQGRELLAWLLTSHRASSIFLEPVTAGNYGAIAAAWFLARSRSIASAIPWLLMAAGIIVLSDGRFGLLLYLLAFLLYVLRQHLHIVATAFAPIFVVSFLIFNYQFWGDNSFPNTFSGRLDYAAHLFIKFDVIDIFGLVKHRAYHDSGYAYAVTQFGLLACVGAWLTLIVVVMRRAPRSYIINYFVIYICLALMTSSSLYSIKASVLLWFMIGIALSPSIKVASPTRYPHFNRIKRHTLISHN